MTRLELLQSLCQGMQAHALEPMHILILTIATTEEVSAPRISNRQRTHIRTAQRYLARLSEEQYLQHHCRQGPRGGHITTYTLTPKGKQFLLQIYTDPQPTAQPQTA